MRGATYRRREAKHEMCSSSRAHLLLLLYRHVRITISPRSPDAPIPTTNSLQNPLIGARHPRTIVVCGRCHHQVGDQVEVSQPQAASYPAAPPTARYHARPRRSHPSPAPPGRVVRFEQQLEELLHSAHRARWGWDRSRYHYRYRMHAQS